MTYRNFLKEISRIAIPISLANLLTTTGSMVDTIMLGAIGETSVGAVGLCAQFSSLMFSSYWGILNGGTLFFSQYWGAKNEEGINRSYGMVVTCVLSVGFLFGFFALLGPQLVMAVYTDKSIYQQIGARYLRIVGLAYPLQLYAMSMSGLLRSTNQVRIPLIASIASVCTNMFLNWVLIFGHFGAPRLGVEGAAAATVGSALVNVMVVLILAKRVHYTYLFAFKKHFDWNVAALKLFFGKCIPIVCNELAMGISNLVINMILGRQVTEAIAALAVFRTIEGLIIAFFTGVSAASSVLAGNRVGSGELEDAHKLANRCVYLCAGMIFIVCVTIYALHEPLLHTMGLHSSAFDYATQMLLVYCIIAVLRMSNWLSNDTWRASGDAVTGTCLEILFMYVLNIPLLCLGGLVWHLPFLAVFTFSYIDEPIRFVIEQIHMHSGGWIRPVTTQGQNALPEFRRNHPLRFFWTKIGLKENF